MSLAAGQVQKELGLYAVELNNADLVVLARDVARLISCLKGSVTIDEVRAHPSIAGRFPSSPNVWGSIFRGKGWEVVGQEPSRLSSNHARRILRWRWVPA